MMRYQLYRSVVLATLTSALVLLSVDVSATEATILTGCTDGTVSDGHCDVLNNIDDCGRSERSKDIIHVTAVRSTLTWDSGCVDLRHEIVLPYYGGP